MLSALALLVSLAFSAFLPWQTAAQTPSPAPCGFPTGGRLPDGASYTLTADCTQLTVIALGGSATIDGAGYTIDASALTNTESVFFTSCDTNLTLSNVTISGGGHANGGAINANGDLTLSKVTFRAVRNTAISANACGVGGSDYQINDVLVDGVQGTYSHYDGAGSVITANNDARVTTNNLVFRNVLLGNAAINSWLGATITINGCLSYDRVFPRVFSVASGMISGALTDNSTGPCTGTIGNGDPVAVPYDEPVKAACRLPSGGLLESSANYTLVADCHQTSNLFIPEGLDVVINGNGHTIYGLKDTSAIYTAGNLTIRNAILSGATNADFLVGIRPDNHLLVEDSIIRGNQSAVYLLDHPATFNRVLFEDNRPWRTGISASVMVLGRSSRVIIRDTGVIGNIWIGFPFARHAPPSLLFEGCLTWDGSAPATVIDTASYVTDSSTGECMSIPGPIVTARPRMAVREALWEREIDSCESDDMIEALPMGAIACVFRTRDTGHSTVLAVYGVNEQSEGFFWLSATQSQLDAAQGESIIAISPDGHVLLVMWPDRNVTIKVGPNAEGKILHMTLAEGLFGPVIGTTSTYGGPPGAAYLAAAASAVANNCMVTTTHIVNLRESPKGSVIEMVPYQSTLTVLTRADSWWQVDHHGAIGWISGQYAKPNPNCG